MIRAILMIGFALAGLVAAPETSRAGFGDCADGAYRALFDERLADVPYDCVERLRLSVTTADGPSEIRLIHDVSADWAMDPGLIDEAERGLRAAAAALARIGPFRMDHVTVLLIDDLPPRERGSFSDIAALTGASAGDECRIGLYLLSRGADSTHAATSLAHELFHCVQLATFSAEQMATFRAGIGEGGDWWIEGSAEWFAALALPDPDPLHDRVAVFNEVSAETPLHDMAYEAVVFFLWLGADRGPTSIMPFLRGMASRPGIAAQRAAMQAALPADDWLRFAEAYLDRDIRHPHGTPLPLEPADGGGWTWTETRTERIRLAPFVLARGWLAFECGRWATATRPASARHAVRAEGEDWRELPPTIDTEAGDAARFRLGAINATTAPVELRVEGRLEAGCSPCAGSSAIDACLVGAWQQTGGGAVAWMRRNLPPGMSIPTAESSNEVVVLNADGTFWTAPVSQGMTMLIERSDGTARADGETVTRASGRWSAEGGRLNFCADAQSVTGRAVLTPPSGPSTTMPVNVSAASGAASFGYRCGGASLETRMTFPGIADPMTTQFSRIGPASE